MQTPVKSIDPDDPLTHWLKPDDLDSDLDFLNLYIAIGCSQVWRFLLNIDADSLPGKTFHYYRKSILSNRIITSIICDCYIREYYKLGQSGFLSLTRQPTHLTRIFGLTQPCCNAGLYTSQLIISVDHLVYLHVRYVSQVSI